MQYICIVVIRAVCKSVIDTDVGLITVMVGYRRWKLIAKRGKRGKDKKPRKRRTDKPTPFINSTTAWDDRTLERGGHSDW